MTTASTDRCDSLDIRPARLDDVSATDLDSPPTDQDAPLWQRSLVAADHDHVVGFGSITLDQVTDTYVVEIVVAPDHRRRGIGTRLFAAVCEVADRPFPICGRVMISQPWRAAFAEALGCEALVRCPAPWIDPVSEAAQNWAGRRATPVGLRIQPMSETDTDLVIDAWATYFEWTHRRFGVVHPEHLRDRWNAYADTLDPDTSMIILDSTGTVLAVSLVSPGGWQGRTFVVAETVDPQQPNGDHLLGATVAASIKALARRGVRLVELEGHSTDPHIPRLVDTLPSAGGDPMTVVRLTRPAGSHRPSGELVGSVARR